MKFRAILRYPRLTLEAALFVLAIGLGAAASIVDSTDTAYALYFVAWCAALLLLLSLGLRLPLHPRGRLSRLLGPGVVLAGLGIALLANIALYRHDEHFDATVTGRFTPPPELETIAGSLQGDVFLSYFYNNKDDNAYAAKEVLAVVARQHPRLKVRALDLDTEIVAARENGVRVYNTVVVEAGNHRTQIENTADLRQMAYAIERVLKRRTQTVCFMVGHGERYASGHVHYTHVESLGSDSPGQADLLEGPPDGLDRLKLALETIGFDDRPIEPAMLPAIPEDCAVVADLGPLTAYTPAEVQALGNYLRRGGHALLAYGPQFPVTRELATLLDGLGLAVRDGVVVDPTNHYGADEEQAAVPYYPPHAITDQIALTVFPDARPIRLGKPKEGAQSTALVATSRDSYIRPLNPSAAPDTARVPAPGPRLLAAAVQENPPEPSQAPCRVVLIGNASFATNKFFPFASNGDLAVSMIRWLADDNATPLLKPEAHSEPEMRLTHRQMQVTFLLVEVLLPLTVMLFGAVVVWRRR